MGEPTSKNINPNILDETQRDDILWESSNNLNVYGTAILDTLNGNCGDTSEFRRFSWPLTTKKYLSAFAMVVLNKRLLPKPVPTVPCE
jgi:hypothetical protein